MKVRFSILLRFSCLLFLAMLNNLFSSYCNSFAEQVVISSDKVTAPTFKTKDAVCSGPNANTHINLGFSGVGTSITDGSYTTVGGGDSNSASGNSSTVGGGFNNNASHTASTIGGGASNIAGGSWSTVVGGVNNRAWGDYSTISGGAHNMVDGDFSWAGGEYMQLTEAADHSFVWGDAEYGAPEIEAPNVFLIFPVGTAGKVGIGTKSPEQILHLVGANPRIWVEGSSGNPEVNFLNSGDPSSVRWALYKDSASDDFRIYQDENRVTIQSATGNVGIGINTPSYKLEVAGNAAKSIGGTVWSVSSDVRLKDITGEYKQGLEAISSLRPITFYYKKGNSRGLPNEEENIGFIAQEVQEVFPEAVTEGLDGYLDFNMHPVNVAVINAIKELRAENDALKAKNASLKRDIEKIKAVLGITNSTGI